MKERNSTWARKEAQRGPTSNQTAGECGRSCKQAAGCTPKPTATPQHQGVQCYSEHTLEGYPCVAACGRGVHTASRRCTAKAQRTTTCCCSQSSRVCCGTSLTHAPLSTMCRKTYKPLPALLSCCCTAYVMPLYCRPTAIVLPLHSSYWPSVVKTASPALSKSTLPAK